MSKTGSNTSRESNQNLKVNHSQLLGQKVKLEYLEEEIIDLWHYVSALRLRLKDD